MTAHFTFNTEEADKATNEDIVFWLEAKDTLAKAKAKESILRAKIVKTFFPTPVEGTNKAELGNGYGFKLVHKIDRKVDTAMFTNLTEQLVAAGIPKDQLVEFKPELKITPYRTLTDEQRQVFDQCITAKPGSPTLEFIKPKPTE